VEITEVRIKLMEEAGERLQAFCSITFDNAFVIRDLKIIEGTNGPFVAMPSRKLTSHCSQCGCKNHLRAAFCNQCGARMRTDRALLDEDGRAKLYADIAHPINSTCREMIQEHVIREFHEELERAKLPGYTTRYEDFDHDDSPSARRDHAPRYAAVDGNHSATSDGHRSGSKEPRFRGPHRGSYGGPSLPHLPASNQPTTAIGQMQPVDGKQDGFGAGIL
jgi:stage V sporulation protein G